MNGLLFGAVVRVRALHLYGLMVMEFWASTLSVTARISGAAEAMAVDLKKLLRVIKHASLTALLALLY
jgi:hypothetical protein